MTSSNGQEQQETDFEFAWWLSMTPAIVAAVYFIWRWTQHRNEGANLVYGGVAVVLGILFTALICAAPGAKGAEKTRTGRASVAGSDVVPGCDSDRGPSVAPENRLAAPCSAMGEGGADGARELVADRAGDSGSSGTLTLSDLERTLEKRTIDADIDAVLKAAAAEVTETVARANQSAPPPGSHDDLVNGEPKMPHVITPADSLSIVKPSEEDAERWYQKGIKLSQSGNYRDALYCFSYVLQHDACNVRALVSKGDCLCRVKRYSEALKCYSQASGLDADNIDAKKGIAFANKAMQEDRERATPNS